LEGKQALKPLIEDKEVEVIEGVVSDKGTPKSKYGRFKAIIVISGVRVWIEGKNIEEVIQKLNNVNIGDRVKVTYVNKSKTSIYNVMEEITIIERAKPEEKEEVKEADVYTPSVEQVVTPDSTIRPQQPRQQLPVSMLIKPVASVDEIVSAWNQFEELKRRLLNKEDIALIPVKQNGRLLGYKPFIKRSGWRKLATAFGLSYDIARSEKFDRKGYYVWRFWVRVIHLPSGRYVIDEGACSSIERNFSHGEADVMMTAETRAVSRAISNFVGGGALSGEEVEGLDLTPETVGNYVTVQEMQDIQKRAKDEKLIISKV